MTISGSPELQRAKAILGNSTLASGARERIYWRIVHKPARVGRGRWRVSMMVFGWLTAASAAYGLGRIVYSALPVLGNEPAAMSAAQPTGEAMRRRSQGHGRAAATGSDRSAAPVSSASPSTAAMPPATPTTPIATATTATAPGSGVTSMRHLQVTTKPHATTRGNEVAIATLAPAATGQSAPNVALATSTPAAVPGQPTTDVARDQESPKPLTGPMRAREDAPGSDGASELSLQVADYKRAVALLNAQPEAALERLYAHQRQWPGSAIAQEVDLRIIQSLLALGRTDSARAAARSFLLHYPGSARTQEVSRIANANH